MSGKSGLRLIWSTLIIGGALIELTHRPGIRTLGAFVSIFGFVGFLCAMLVEKIGNYRPR
jgi:hypothetical protein